MNRETLGHPCPDAILLQASLDAVVRRKGALNGEDDDSCAPQAFSEYCKKGENGHCLIKYVLGHVTRDCRLHGRDKASSWSGTTDNLLHIAG